MTAVALSPLEIACGLVFGLEPREPLPAERDGAHPPRRALEAVVADALSRPPCLVSFSGGRDSSAVLAVATAVARREGLDLPIPATSRFAGVAATDETAWQERVVAHLGLSEWAKVDHGDELDCLGPVAQRALRRHGLLWPFNAHFHVPMFELARGGTVLTGVGGDEALTEPVVATTLAELRRRPTRRDLRRVAFLLAPHPVRRLALRGKLPLPFPWLRPEARAEVARLRARQNAEARLRWSEHVRWIRRLRYLRIGTRSLELLAADANVQVVHPFLDAGFMAALARMPRRDRFRDRTGAMRALFGDVLPDDVLSRTTKASFNGTFWNRPSREFAATWDGSGVDDSLVDVEALRTEWASPSPDPRSHTLAQAAWLAANVY